MGRILGIALSFIHANLYRAFTALHLLPPVNDLTQTLTVIVEKNARALQSIENELEAKRKIILVRLYRAIPDESDLRLLKRLP